MTRTEQLLAFIDEAYERQAWHGPNLKGSLRGITAAEALRRPARGRHNIWEVVLHAAYWKYAVRRRITGAARGSFPLKGSNWFRRGGKADGGDWKADLALLEAEHRRLRASIAALTDRELDRTPPGTKVSTLRMVQGIAAHDIYHAGQIQLLKRLTPA